MKEYKNSTRTVLAFFQALIDALIYYLSLSIIIWLWISKNSDAGFTFELKMSFTGTMILVFYFNSLYSFKTWLFWDEIKAVLKSSLLMLLIIVFYIYSQGFSLSRFAAAASVIIFVPLCLTARYLFRIIFFKFGILVTNMLILGAGKTGEIFARKVINHPFTVCRIAGFLDDDPEKQGTEIAGSKVRGKIEDFAVICAGERIDEAAVAISTASRSLLTHILDIVEFHVRQVHYIPDMYMLTTFSSSIKDIGGMPVISAAQGLLNPFNMAVKNITDYFLSVMALILFSPLMLWAAWRIKREYEGKAISGLTRAGRGMKTFTMYKFRTRYEGRRNLTKTGKFLRRLYIDELPKLFNVLKGEMSIVGPMPLTIKDLEHLYDDETAAKICRIKPGITGFWQISRKTENDKDIRAEMSLYYMRNWSLWVDTVIILKTFFVVLTRKRKEYMRPEN